MNKSSKMLLAVSLCLGVLALALPTNTYAQEKLAGNSAILTMKTASKPTVDARVTKLKKYLEKYNSPLADSADVFVREADRNNLDWKFVAAISGVESTFGKHIPAYSYNGWGYGIYGGNVRRFATWDDAITTISSEIRSKYMTKWGAKDVYSIGHIYAASPTWAARVQRFMNQIDNFDDKPELATLPISL